MAFLDEGMVHDKERYKGCLIGAVIGDSLGAPFEFRNKWQNTYTLSRDDVLAEIDPVRMRLIPMRHTDDAAMTLQFAGGFSLR